MTGKALVERANDRLVLGRDSLSALVGEMADELERHQALVERLKEAMTQDVAEKMALAAQIHALQALAQAAGYSDVGEALKALIEHNEMMADACERHG